MMPERKLLSEFGAAELLNIPVAQVRKLAREGKIPVVEITDDILRFDGRELVNMIQMRTRPAAEPLTTR